LFVRVDYLTDDAQAEIVDRFFEAYLLWLFGFVLFRNSLGDAVSRYWIPHARRIPNAPLDVVPHVNWGNAVLSYTYGGCARVEMATGRNLSSSVVPYPHCDNPPRKIPYYRLNQSTLVIKQ
jgi:hypothetical protein